MPVYIYDEDAFDKITKLELSIHEAEGPEPGARKQFELFKKIWTMSKKVLLDMTAVHADRKDWVVNVGKQYWIKSVYAHHWYVTFEGELVFSLSNCYITECRKLVKKLGFRAKYFSHKEEEVKGEPWRIIE